MRRLFFALTGFCVFVPAACFQALPTTAQTAASKPVDPKMAAAQAAFEALPDEQRRAIQNDLVWATDYSGAALGTFGKLTFEALSAFEKKAGGPVDAILDPAQRQKLSDAANKARASVGFKVVQDPNTGSGIGIATKYIGKLDKAVSGSKWTFGNDIILETVRTKPDKADMAATFERFVNAVVDGRKVTYKLLRPDFFVVTGELASQKFYTRFAPTPDGLRGYTLTYNPNISPDIEKLVIATANTFEPIISGKNGEVEPAAKDVPTAALCYVWDNKHAVGYSRPSPYTTRVQMIVLQSGAAHAGTWVNESRDVAADFKTAFGFDAPAITGVAVGSDTDQTRESVRTWFGDVVLTKGLD